MNFKLMVVKRGVDQLFPLDIKNACIFQKIVLVYFKLYLFRVDYLYISDGLKQVVKYLVIVRLSV